MRPMRIYVRNDGKQQDLADVLKLCVNDTEKNRIRYLSDFRVYSATDFMAYTAYSKDAEPWTIPVSAETIKNYVTPSEDIADAGILRGSCPDFSRSWPIGYWYTNFDDDSSHIYKLKPNAERTALTLYRVKEGKETEDQFINEFCYRQRIIICLQGPGGAGGGYEWQAGGRGAGSGGGSGGFAAVVVDASKTWYIKLGKRGICSGGGNGGADCTGEDSWISSYNAGTANPSKTTTDYCICHSGKGGLLGKYDKDVDGGEGGKVTFHRYNSMWKLLSQDGQSGGVGSSHPRDGAKGKEQKGFTVYNSLASDCKKESYWISYDSDYGQQQSFLSFSEHVGGDQGDCYGAYSGGGGGGACALGHGGKGARGRGEMNEHEMGSEGGLGAGGGGAGEGSAWTNGWGRGGAGGKAGFKIYFESVGRDGVTVTKEI